VQYAPPSRRPIRFGAFELDTEAAELRKQGVKVKLQDQPFQVLQILLENPGKLVAREELQRRIWPSDTFVDFDQGLYNAAKKLREVLSDSAESPRFIETVPRRGYRFIGAVEGNGPAAPTPALPLEATKPTSGRNFRLGIVVGLGAAIAVGAAVGVERFWRHSFSSGPDPLIRSIAVLPLQNLSDDPAQEYFSDGMTDALITDLAQIGSVKVISRTSSMQYKQTKKPLPEIARELNVDGIIEGTVQRSGNRVRITAQLIYGPSDKHIWADSYERDVRDVFPLEREVANDIAGRVRARITTQNQSIPVQTRAVNLKALDFYLQGNYHLNRAGDVGSHDEEFKRADALFQHSIDADPGFAPAYIGLAETHHDLWSSSAEDIEIMKSASKRALELAPGSSEAHTELALTKWEEWDWSGAEEEYRKAVTLNPNNTFARDQFGGYLDAMGRLEEGWKEQQLAQELDPASDHVSWALYRRGDYDRAIERLQTTLQTRPDDGVLHWLLSEIYAQKGMHKEWILELSKSMTLLGMPETAGRLQHAFATSGYSVARRLWTRELEQWAATKQGYFPGMLAQVYASLDDNDRAFYWLKQGCEHYRDQGSSDPILQWTKIDPGLAPLRSDPRFKGVLRCMGLSE